MIPTTLTSVLLFLAALGPGFIYVRRVETLEARYKVSAFRETASIVITSLAFLAVALVAFTVLRTLFPAHTPDIGALLHAPRSYALSNYQYLATWTCGLFALALALAVLCSHPLVRRSHVWTSKAVLAIRGRPIMDARSSWSRLFSTEDGTIVRAACELDDGSWVDGWVFDWNAQPEEDGDRTLTLHAPLRVRPKGSDSVSPLAGIAYSVIANSKIVRIDVTHVEEAHRPVFDASYTVQECDVAKQEHEYQPEATATTGASGPLDVKA